MVRSVAPPYVRPAANLSRNERSIWLLLQRSNPNVILYGLGKGRIPMTEAEARQLRDRPTVEFIWSGSPTERTGGGRWSGSCYFCRSGYLSAAVRGATSA